MFKSFIVLACLVAVAYSLGAVCERSKKCRTASADLTDLITIAKTINLSRSYKPGKNIICRRDNGTLFKPKKSGICVVYEQDSLRVDRMTNRIPGVLVKELLKELRANGCDKCGSIPIAFKSGNLNQGRLTVKHVDDTHNCNGLC